MFVKIHWMANTKFIYFVRNFKLHLVHCIELILRTTKCSIWNKWIDDRLLFQVSLQNTEIKEKLKILTCLWFFTSLRHPFIPHFSSLVCSLFGDYSSVESLASVFKNITSPCFFIKYEVNCLKRKLTRSRKI